MRSNYYCKRYQKLKVDILLIRNIDPVYCGRDHNVNFKYRLFLVVSNYGTFTNEYLYYWNSYLKYITRRYIYFFMLKMDIMDVKSYITSQCGDKMNSLTINC